MGAKYVLLFAVLLTSLASAQQTSAPAASADQHPVERDLAASAEIVRQEVCRVTAVDFAIHFTIKLSFTNTSDHRVILARDIDSYPMLRIAKNFADMQSGNLEYQSMYDLITGLSPVPQLSDRPDERYFVTLLPRQTFEATITSAIFVPEKSAKTGRGPQGSHVLQAEINSLPYQSWVYENPIDANQLSKRWSKYGHLASGWIRSDTVSFSFPKQLEVSPCSVPRS